MLGLSVYLNIDWHLSQNIDRSTLINSALLNATLFHAWAPNWTSFWNWPTWALSALLFLYLTTPYLVLFVKKLADKSLLILFILLPLISMGPTLFLMVWGNDNDQSISQYIGGFSSLPIMWIPAYLAGMILAKYFGSQQSLERASKKVSFSWTDIAIFALIVITIIPQVNEQWKFILRHGALIPIFLTIIYGLANQRGFIAKLLKLKMFLFLGNISFSIFIWQGTLITLIWFWTTSYPSQANYQIFLATLGMLLIATISTHFFEKPVSHYLRGLIK